MAELHSNIYYKHDNPATMPALDTLFLEASALFTETEWKGAYILAKKAVPKTEPSIHEVVRQIAMLGGFLGRKGDSEPGVKILWLGMQRLRDCVEGMAHAGYLQC